MSDKTIKQALPLREYKKGVYHSPTYRFDDDIQTVRIYIPRAPFERFPKTIIFNCLAYSIVGGKKFSGAGVPVEGGIYRTKNGNVATFTDVMFNVPEGSDRKIYIFFEVFFTLIFTFDLEFYQDDKLLYLKQKTKRLFEAN